MYIFLASCLVFISLMIGLKNPKFMLYIAVFLSPWQGLDIDIGLRITGFRIAMVVLVVTILLRSCIGIKATRETVNSKFWLLFIFYALLSSFVNVFMLPTISVHSGELRLGQMRSVAQIVMFGLSILPVILIPYVVRRAEDIFQCGRVYLWSVTILAALGFFQIFVWYGTGMDPFPIGFVNSLLVDSSPEMLRSGVYIIDRVNVYRMSSFGGEPKSLGTGLAVGLLILQVGFSVLNLRRKIRIRAIMLWGFLMLALILTWSTSAAFLWLIGTCVLTISGLGIVRGKYGVKYTITGMFLLLVVIGSVYITIRSNQNQNIGNVYPTVMENRFVTRNLIEDFDETVIRFIMDQPKHLLFGVGLGNVHLHAEPYIPDYALYYMKNSIFVAKSGYLRIISELGIVGFLLLSAAVFIWVLRLRRLAFAYFLDTNMKQLMLILYSLGIILFVGGMARTYVWPQMYIVLGLCVSCLGLFRVLRKREFMFRGEMVNSTLHQFELRPHRK